MKQDIVQSLQNDGLDILSASIEISDTVYELTELIESYSTVNDIKGVIGSNNIGDAFIAYVGNSFEIIAPSFTTGNTDAILKEMDESLRNASNTIVKYIKKFIQKIIDFFKKIIALFTKSRDFRVVLKKMAKSKKKLKWVADLNLKDIYVFENVEMLQNRTSEFLDAIDKLVYLLVSQEYEQVMYISIPDVVTATTLANNKMDPTTYAETTLQLLESKLDDTLLKNVSKLDKIIHKSISGNIPTSVVSTLTKLTSALQNQLAEISKCLLTARLAARSYS